MGNFVSSSCSTSSPPATTQPASLPSPPSTSHHKDRTTLTSHATQLAHLPQLSSITGNRIHVDDIEEGLTLPGTRGRHVDTDVLDGRRRALLIGIAYHGELLNTHKDLDRYRDVLLGTHPRSLLFVFYLFSPFVLLSRFFPIVSYIIVLLHHRHVWVQHGRCSGA